MARTLTTGYKESVNSTGAVESPMLCLEITHPGLIVPARVVNDNRDIVINGITYTALSFQAIPPDDLENSMPKATLAIDNVGEELTQWIESSSGGRGAKVRMFQVMRSNPDIIEWEVELDLSNVGMDANTITGTLIYEDLLNQPAVTVTYRPETAPELF